MTSYPFVATTSACLATLATGPLHNVVTPYVEALRTQRYAERTINHYLRGLVHLSHWMRASGRVLSDINAPLIEEFTGAHSSGCSCRQRPSMTAAELHAALRRLLNHVPSPEGERPEATPVAVEVGRFADYLENICGLTATTWTRRCREVKAFLTFCFDTTAPVMAALSPTQIEAFMTVSSRRLRPSTLGVIGCDLRSYFRFRALQGDATGALIAAVPRTAAPRQAALPSVLSDAQREMFLQAFDRCHPVECRDYAIARCLLDLGLRADEVTRLSLESMDWHRGTLTLRDTKSKRAHCMPLPVATGEAITHYLRDRRPATVDRRLFVRHRAPWGRPLTVSAIRNSMNRAFVRCGLGDRFCSTHVLRRTAATRWQRSGASVKEIADLLRHRSLDTASRYARMDIERLRAVSLPWPGDRS